MLSGASAEDIVSRFPGRSATNCLYHWQYLSSRKSKYSNHTNTPRGTKNPAWTAAENELLRSLRLEGKTWVQVSTRLNNRTCKACRLQFHRCFPKRDLASLAEQKTSRHDVLVPGDSNNAIEGLSTLEESSLTISEINRTPSPPPSLPDQENIPTSPTFPTFDEEAPWNTGHKETDQSIASMPTTTPSGKPVGGNSSCKQQDDGYPDLSHPAPVELPTQTSFTREIVAKSKHLDENNLGGIQHSNNNEVEPNTQRSPRKRPRKLSISFITNPSTGPIEERLKRRKVHIHATDKNRNRISLSPTLRSLPSGETSRSHLRRKQAHDHETHKQRPTHSANIPLSWFEHEGLPTFNVGSSDSAVDHVGSASSRQRVDDKESSLGHREEVHLLEARNEIYKLEAI